MVGIGLSQPGGQQLTLDTAVYDVKATVADVANSILSRRAIGFSHFDALNSGLDAQDMRGAKC